jgi:hypothetical protein
VNNNRSITTAEATVKTVTITVKAISINNKQMTLSMFRQLEDEDILDVETLQLRGVPWGWVNYHFNNCQTDYGAEITRMGPHLHLIWQKDNELRCCVLYLEPCWDSQVMERLRRPSNSWSSAARAAGRAGPAVHRRLRRTL